MKTLGAAKKLGGQINKAPVAHKTIRRNASPACASPKGSLGVLGSGVTRDRGATFKRL